MKILVVAVVLIFALSAMAFAGANPAAKTAIHVRPHNAKLACNVTIVTCADIVTTEPGFSVDAFTVHFDLNEYLGTEYGVCWPAWTYSAAFSNCSDLVIGAVVNPGDGASHTWTACQAGVAVSSYLWLYADAPGMICPCDHPQSGANTVLDCASGTDSPVCYFCAGVYGAIGDDPCAPTGTEQSTWSEIKALF